MKVEGSGHGLPSLAPGRRALTTHCFGFVHNCFVERQCDVVLKRKMGGGEKDGSQQVLVLISCFTTGLAIRLWASTSFCLDVLVYEMGS